MNTFFVRGPTHTCLYSKIGKIVLIASDQDIKFQKETVKAGGSFGIAALMAVQPHMVTAVAAENNGIMVLSRQSLLKIRHDDIDLFALLMTNIAREIAPRLKLADDIFLQYIHEDKDSRE